jgi:hypothetical protein
LAAIWNSGVDGRRLPSSIPDTIVVVPPELVEVTLLSS